MWLELNQSWTHATDDSGFIPNDSIIAAPAQDIPQPSAGEWLEPQEHQEQATDSICGENAGGVICRVDGTRQGSGGTVAGVIGFGMEDQIADGFDEWHFIPTN